MPSLKQTSGLEWFNAFELAIGSVALRILGVALCLENDH